MTRILASIANWLLWHIPSLREASFGHADGIQGLPPDRDNRHYLAGYRVGREDRRKVSEGG